MTLREKEGVTNCYALISAGMASFNNVKHCAEEKEGDQFHLSVKDFQISTKSGNSKRHCFQRLPFFNLLHGLLSYVRVFF